MQDPNPNQPPRDPDKPERPPPARERPVPPAPRPEKPPITPTPQRPARSPRDPRRPRPEARGATRDRSDSAAPVIAPRFPPRVECKGPPIDGWQNREDELVMPDGTAARDAISGGVRFCRRGSP